MISFLIKLFIKDGKNISSHAVQKAYAKICSCIDILLNILLFFIKLFSGIVSGSTSIIADGYNNLSDAATSVAVFIGFCLAGIGAGENHRFGHGRYEWLMGLISSMAVMMVGWTLAKGSLSAINIPQPITCSTVIIVILICSILIKLYMYCYNKKISAKIDSSTMKATATDCISDMVSTSAIFISLIAERLTGWHIDGWCGLIVSLFIIFSALKSIMEIIDRLMGQSTDKNLEDRIINYVMGYSAVHGINNLLIHDYGMGNYAVSLHIEGHAGDNCDTLTAAAQQISYGLFVDMDCDATIQTDILVTDPIIVQNISAVVEQTVKTFEETAQIKNLRIIQSGMNTNVILTVCGSRQLQKRERDIKQTVEAAICSSDKDYHVITKLVIMALHRI